MKIKLIAAMLFTLLFLGMCPGVPAQEPKEISRKKAMLIAEILPEVRGLYELSDQHFRNCIEKEVLRPCDTDWVTCRDNSWVVKFWLGETCGVKHDGRLSVTVVLDSITGKVVSKFPESNYFDTPEYCLENYDCLAVKENGFLKCFNFIYAQAEHEMSLEPQNAGCECVNNVCVIGALDKIMR